MRPGINALFTCLFYFVLRETTRLPAITPAKGRPQVGADPALSLYGFIREASIAKQSARDMFRQLRWGRYNSGIGWRAPTY